MSPLRRISIALLVALSGGLSAVALGACGEDDILGDDARDVRVSLTERDLAPGRVEVRAGEIEFVVRNKGERLHAFAVETPDGVERTENIEPGETASLTVDLSEGRYRMYDPRGGYRTRGVSGTIVVTSADTETVTERTVERTVVEEPESEAPEVDDPEVQEPEVQEPQATPPPPPPPVQPPPPARTVTKEVPVEPPPVEGPTSP